MVGPPSLMYKNKSGMNEIRAIQSTTNAAQTNKPMPVPQIEKGVIACLQSVLIDLRGWEQYKRIESDTNF